MGKMHYEIREYCEGKGEGLWLFLNDGLCRGYTTASIEKHNLDPETIRESFRDEVRLYGGTLTDVESTVYL